MEDKFDGILFQMVNQAQGYEGFFDIIFSYLKRKTDFFTDFKKAEAVIANAGKKHIEDYARTAKEKKEKEAEETKRREEKEKKLREQKEQTAPPKPAPEASPVDRGITTPPNTPISTHPPTAVKEGEEKSDKIPPNLGNGSKTDKYVWTQTLDEVQANVYIPSKTTKKDMDIRLELDRCYIAMKDKSQVFVDAKWCEKIHPDDSYWTIEEIEGGGKAVQLTLSKYSQTAWWDCLVQGEPVIDTQKVSPEPSKLSDLDGEMKSTVEKMMIDMRRKQAGMPSLEEEEKKNKLAEFMKAHPEMDFSNCKFN
jgi:hypothetical protein